MQRISYKPVNICGIQSSLKEAFEFCWSSLADEHNTFPKSTIRHVKLDTFTVGIPWLPNLLCERWFPSSVWNFCRWVADVPPRETSPAAKSEEKRMFWQAKLCGTICQLKVYERGTFSGVEPWGGDFVSAPNPPPLFHPNHKPSVAIYKHILKMSHKLLWVLSHLWSHTIFKSRLCPYETMYCESSCASANSAHSTRQFL